MINTERLKSEINILTLARTEGLELKRSGGHCWVTRCCFHQGDNDPSLTFHEVTNSFFCYGCGGGGDIIEFYSKIKNISPGDALKELAQSIGLSLEAGAGGSRENKNKSDVLDFLANIAHENLLDSENKNALNYLTENRGLKPETITKYRLGYIPDGFKMLNSLKKKYSFEQLEAAGLISKSKKDDRKNLLFFKCIIFPYFRGNKVIYMTSRGFPEKSHRKLININCDFMYCEDCSCQDKIILTEGEIDCLTLRQAGYNAWGIPGARSFKETWIKRVSKFKHRYIFFDSDEAGKKAAGKLAEMINSRIVCLEE